MSKPIIVKTTAGYAIMHETGLYFLDKNDDLNKYIAEISQKKRPMINSEKKEKLAKVIIYLSTDCNLRCIYCYASSGEHHSIVSIENAKIFIKYVAQKVDKLILDFHGGGEPLLHFDIIKELHQYAQNTGKLYRTVLISNGVIAFEDKKEDILDWIIHNVDVMALSCDGLPTIQNQNRPKANGLESSYDVENTIKYFNKHDYIYTVRSTITRESSKYLLEITKYFCSLGVKYLIYSPCYNFGRTNDSEIVPEPHIYVNNYMESIKYAYKNGIRITSNSFRYPGYHYCGALASFNMALTTDNFISSCYEVIKSTNDEANMFIIGEIKDGKVKFFKENIEKLNNFEINRSDKCCFCDYRLVCRGGCPIKKLRNSEDSLNNLCAITRLLVPQMLDFLQENPQAASSVLKNIEILEM